MSPPALTVTTAYPRVVEELTPFLVSVAAHRAGMELAPFGLSIRRLVDPMRMASRLFMERIQAVDRLAFGPRGLHMPQWIFIDGSTVTGALFGFAIPPDRLDGRARAALELGPPLPDLVPLSIYGAIPTHRPGLWMGHNLASLGGRLPELGLRGLGLLTKAFALRAFGVRRQCGVTQWRAEALHIHCRFGPLELMSAYTPAHTRPDSLTYAWDVSETRLRAALGDPGAAIERPEPHLHIDGDDRDAMIRLQREIEAGRHVIIPGPPETTRRGVRVPVAYVD